MVRENEFCYRYSSQTGILFLLWTISILCGIWIIIDVIRVTEESQIIPKEYTWSYFKILLALFYKISILVVSLTGLYGIIKKKPQYLAIFYYYNYFQLLLISVFIAYLLLYPAERRDDILTSKTKAVENQAEATHLTFAFLLTGLAFQIYFIILFRNHYQMMKEQNLSRSRIFIFTYPEYVHDYGFA